MKLLRVSAFAQTEWSVSPVSGLFLSNCYVHLAIILDYGVVVIKNNKQPRFGLLCNLWLYENIYHADNIWC